ncbi:MAG: hypothetical protein HYS25_07455 [Ignavibacteriales bacterium]|nr:hypothetical protein [Ignavibacteriales bacterium]
MDNYAIDTAARFGDIPFTEFTKELVTGVFDSLLDAHIEQMEAYSSFVNSLTQDLSTYINNTVDGVSFSDVSDFLLKYELPKLDGDDLKNALNALENPSTTAKPITVGTSATSDTWWGGLINAVGPAVTSLADKVKDSNLQANLNAVKDFNSTVQAKIPTYQAIQQSIAALIASNKYGLLQNMAKQGMMRLVVTEGEVETKITFSTWNNSSSGSESSDSQKTIDKSKAVKAAGIIGLFKSKNKTKNKTVTINTAKSYQRDSSGTRVDIFGRVLIRFKTDYAPLNG